APELEAGLLNVLTETPEEFRFGHRAGGRAAGDEGGKLERPQRGRRRHDGRGSGGGAARVSGRREQVQLLQERRDGEELVDHVLTAVLELLGDLREIAAE